MSNELKTKYTEKLAKYTLSAFFLAIVIAICWFFRSVIVYILVAMVVSLITKPFMDFFKKIKIKGKSAPVWILAIISLILVLAIILSVIVLIFPIVANIIKDISIESLEHSLRGISAPLEQINIFIRENIPSAGDDFRLEVAAVNELQNIFSVSKFSAILGSAASFISSFGVGLFAVVFIGFFFTKDDKLFTKMICALVPDELEKKTEETIDNIGHLLSRYFTGVLMEVAGVAIINFFGLWLIARLGFNASIGIAFIAGVMNIIPYLGPLLGGAIGTILGIIIKYSSITPIGLDVGFWVFTIILIAIFSFTQLIDNFFYQPLIYSTSIKAKPLEVFIVMLMAGTLGGPLAMILAIPCYTVIRVVALKFFSNYKAIKRLVGK